MDGRESSQDDERSVELVTSQVKVPLQPEDRRITNIHPMPTIVRARTELLV